MIPDPTDPLRVLIIDDIAEGRGGGFWHRLAGECGCDPLLVTGGTSADLFVKLQALFVAGRTFDGTVLDIGFQGEADGGIRLWERLTRAGLAGQAGGLFVATKFSRPDIGTFAEQHAGGRLCTSLSDDHKAAKFREFVRYLLDRRATSTQGPIRPAFVSKPVWAALSPDVRTALAAIADHFDRRLEPLEAARQP